MNREDSQNVRKSDSEAASTGSVTQWLRTLDKAESSQAQRELWNRYFGRLCALARSRLPADARGESDEEDVALSALDSFFRRAGRHEFPDLSDRSGLWPLLAQITVFKALRNIRRQRTLKRGGTGVLRESELSTLTDGTVPSFEDIVAVEPTAELVTQMNEQVELLIDLLPDQQLKSIAMRKLEGYRNDEIATSLQVGLRTVERKLGLIRSYWLDRVAGE